MNRRAVSAASLVLAACLSTGCYRVTVRSGRAEAPGPPASNGATRGGYVNGMVEENPLHMGMVCKTGWSSAYVETSFLNGLVNGFRGLIYHTQNITLRCAPETAVVPVAAQGPTLIDPSQFPPGTVILPAPAPAPAPPQGAPPNQI